jgi:muramidase (phage lysozyme)
MPASSDTPVPADIIRKDLTSDQVAFLKRNFSSEAADKGLTASFQETSEPSGLTTLVVHFARQGDAASPPAGRQAAKPAAAGENTALPPSQNAAPIQDQHVARFRPMLDFIAKHEGTANRLGGGYNTSLGFGRFIVGGEKILVGMTLPQIDALQTQMLNNPQNHFNSSALGRYQIVQRTLHGLITQLRLSQTDLFDQALQDKLGITLILRRGRDVEGLRSEWASLKSVNSREILAAFDSDGSAQS